MVAGLGRRRLGRVQGALWRRVRRRRRRRAWRARVVKADKRSRDVSGVVQLSVNGVPRAAKKKGWWRDVDTSGSRGKRRGLAASRDQRYNHDDGSESP